MPHPSTSSAYGIWSLNEVRDAVRGDNWPALPLPDPNFADVSLLINADGLADGSTAFVDESNNNLTLTAVGDAQVDTTLFKYGTGSMQFDGTGDEITTSSSDSELFEFVGGDFTVEFWVNTTQTGSYAIVTHASGNGAANTSWGFFGGTPTSNKVGFYASDGATYQISIASSTTINDGNWHHVAIAREGSSFRLFVDGVLENTGTWSGTMNTTDRLLRVGDDGSSINFNGYIDELRITKGVARYTVSFTPPTSAFPTS